MNDKRTSTIETTEGGGGDLATLGGEKDPGHGPLPPAYHRHNHRVSSERGQCTDGNGLEEMYSRPGYYEWRQHCCCRSHRNGFKPDRTCTYRGKALFYRNQALQNKSESKRMPSCGVTTAIALSIDGRRAELGSYVHIQPGSAGGESREEPSVLLR